MESSILSQIPTKTIPIVLTFFLGFLLKKVRVFNTTSADVMLKVVFYISLPALILLAMIHTTLSLDFIYLPIICIITVSVTLLITLIVGRSLHLASQTLGVFIIGPMILNTTFVIPFLLSAYGQEAIARLSVFDVGNNITIYSLVYFFAHRHGSEGSAQGALKTIAQSPILYALCLGLALNTTHVRLPTLGETFLEGMGGMTTPLVMISLGIYFSPTLVRIKATFLSVLIRIIAGFLIALILANLFKLSGLNRDLVLVACSAPVGFTTLTFSAITGLDAEFAASCVSYSILFGLVVTPVLIFFLLS